MYPGISNEGESVRVGLNEGLPYKAMMQRYYFLNKQRFICFALVMKMWSLDAMWRCSLILITVWITLDSRPEVDWL